MTNYNDGKWHGWNGGECPVHPETLVECYGGVNAGKLPIPSRARFRQWEKDTEGRCIDAFRVIKEHKEPREFWVSPESCTAFSFYHAGFIHVREVLE